jgi:2'-5' RNA ligase superfamily
MLEDQPSAQAAPAPKQTIRTFAPPPATAMGAAASAPLPPGTKPWYTTTDIAKLREQQGQPALASPAPKQVTPSPYSLDARMSYAKPGPYVTKLSPQDEQQFQSWVKTNKIPLEDDGPKTGYDLRGFWKAAQQGDPEAKTDLNPFDNRIHYSDKWKTPYSTEGFSRQSIYAKPTAPQWYGSNAVGWRLIGADGAVYSQQGVKDESKFQNWMRKNAADAVPSGASALAGSPQDIASRALAQTGLPPAASPSAPPKTIRDVNGMDLATMTAPLGAAKRGGPSAAYTAEPMRSYAWPAQAARAVKGVGEVIESGAVPPPATRGPAKALPTPEQTRKSLQGGADILTGTMGAAGPFVAPEAAVMQPLRFAGGLAAGYATSKFAKAAAQKLGLSPEAVQFSEALGWFIPAAAGVVKPKVEIASTPEGTALAGEAFGGKVAGGVARTPEGETTVAARVGPRTFRKTFGGQPAEQQAIEPQTIQGEPGAVKPVPAEAYEDVQPSNYRTGPRPEKYAPITPEQKPTEIAKAAAAQQPETVKTAETIAAQIPNARVVDPGAKTAESISRKADSDREITDASRAQIVVPDEAAKKQAVQAIAQQTPAHEIQPIEAKDLPITAAKLPNSQEIQVATEAEHQTQQSTHPIYSAAQEAKSAGDEKKADKLKGELDQALAWHKVNPDPNVEWLPVDEAAKLVPPKNDRSISPSLRDPDYTPKLVEEIKQNGLKSEAFNPKRTDEAGNPGGPIEIGYNAQNGRAAIVDGTHRLNAAKEAGLSYVPVKVTTGTAHWIRPNEGVAAQKPAEENEEYRPSEIGVGRAAPAAAVQPTVLSKGSRVTIDGKPGVIEYASKRVFEKTRVKLDSGEKLEVPHREVSKRIQAQMQTASLEAGRSASSDSEAIRSSEGSNPPSGSTEVQTQSPIAREADPSVAQPPAQGVTSPVSTSDPAPKPGAIAVDLDKTLAEYKEGAAAKDPTAIGKPIPDMVEAVKKAVANGKDVWVYSARAQTPEAINAIKAWTKEHIGQELPVTNVKHPTFADFVDDRAKSPQEFIDEQRRGNGAEPQRAAAPESERTENVREQGPAGILQRQPEEAGEAGSGRGGVEPIQQGQDGRQAAARPGSAEVERGGKSAPGNGEKEKPVEPQFKFGSTQTNIPADSPAAKALAAARDRISKSDLMPSGMGGNQTGLETEPHVTVRYGIQGDDTAGIKAFLAQQAPFEASLGKTGKFPPSEHSDGAAVIIAPIEAPELHRINAELEKHGDFAEPSFPEYKPHATIAYVKPESADRYTGMTVTDGKKFRVDSIAISDRNGNQEVVKLEGAAAAPKKRLTALQKKAAGTAQKLPTVSEVKAKAPKKPATKTPLSAGDVVVFSKVPPGSYLTAGEEYRVESAGKNMANFRSVKTGGGTSENWRMLSLGDYRKVEGEAATEKRRVVPGARSSETGNETGTTTMQDLTDSIRRQVPQSTPLKERIAKAADIGAKSDSLKGAIGETYGKIKGGMAALWDAYNRPPKWGDFEDATGKWSGADQINAHELREFSEAIKKAVPDKLRREAISNWIEAGGDEAVLRERADKSEAPYKAGYEAALKLSDAERTVAQNIISRNDATLEEAQKAGLLTQGVENYVRHIYADNPKIQQRVMAEQQFKNLVTKPSFTKERKLPTYFDAEQLGFTPKDKDVGFLTSSHERAFREALAARAYIKSLMEGKAADGRPLVVTSWASAKEIPPEFTDDGDKPPAYLIRPNIKAGEESADYRRLDHPALRGWKWAGETDDGSPIFVQGDALVHPEIYQKLKNNLGRSAIRNFEVPIGEKTFYPGRTLLNASGQVKSAILSFSGFHQTTLGLHALESGVKPFKMPELNLNDPVQRGAVEHGLTVAHYDAQDAFGEGVASGGLTHKLPLVGPAYHAYTDYLFNDYMPRIKMATYQRVLEQNTKRYAKELNADQLQSLSANEVNAKFGGVNFRMLGRNPTMQDVLRLTVMAPDFTEARMRYAAQAAKPYGRVQLQSLLIGAVALYTAFRVLNEIVDGKPNWSHPFGVLHHGKEYGLRPLQEDIFKATTEPGQYLMNRLSPVLHVAIEGMEGRDYMGRKQTIGQAAKNAARNNVPIPLQPWMRKSHDGAAEKAIESIAKMVGINVKNAKPPRAHRAVAP